MAGACLSPSTCYFAVVCIVLLQVSGVLTIQSAWTHWGGNKENWRFSDHSCIDTARLRNLQRTKPLWNVTTEGTVAATPAVCGGHVYYVDWASRIVKLTLAGKMVWAANAKQLVPGQSRIGVRTTPAFSDGCKVLYVSTQWSESSYLLAINAETGKLQFPAIKLDPNPSTRATSSPTFYKGAVYLGLSSNQENNMEVKQLDFRGSLVKVEASTGEILWQAYTCPKGYAGCSVWGSAPAIDDVRNQVCIGTANLYKVPATVLDCLKRAKEGSPEQHACLAKDAFVDAIVCYDINTGKARWGYRAHGVDIWGNVLPGAPSIEELFPNSKYVTASDYGFGQAPIILKGPNHAQDRVLASSKGGGSWALNATSGAVLWTQMIGPTTGLFAKGYSLFGSCTNGKLFCSGLFWYSKRQGLVACMDVATGRKLWTWTYPQGGVYGPLSCTQGQVFVPLMDDRGTLAVLDIKTGKPLGRFMTGATLFSGPAIVNGIMYVGTGYGSNGGVKGKSIMAVPLGLTSAKCGKAAAPVVG